MDVDVAPHPLDPDTAPVIVSYDGVRHIELCGLVNAGRDLQEQLGFNLLGGSEGDEHVVAGGHDALGPGVVVDWDSLDEPAGGVGTVTDLEEGLVILPGHQVDEVKCQDVTSFSVELLSA